MVALRPHIPGAVPSHDRIMRKILPIIRVMSKNGDHLLLSSMLTSVELLRRQ